MATTRAWKGQTSKVLFAVAFTDATGAAADPTGTPTLKVYLVEAAGTLTLKATLNIAKLVATTGLWGAFQDISNATTWPAGDYQLVGNATIGGVASIVTDTFEVDDSPTSPTAGFASGAYCSEQQVRDVSAILIPGVTTPTAVVLNAIQRASRFIDLKLGGLYVVPFTPTYNDGIVLVCIWLGAGYTFENLQGQRGNTNELGATLIARAEMELADLALGKPVLPLPLNDAGGGAGSVIVSSADRSPAFSVTDDNSPLKGY